MPDLADLEANADTLLAVSSCLLKVASFDGVSNLISAEFIDF